MEEGKLVKYEAQTGEKKWIHTAQDYSNQFGAISGEESAGRKSDGMDESPVDGQKSEIELLQHLMTLGSSQLAVLELEQRRICLHKPKFKGIAVSGESTIFYLMH